MPSVIRSTPKKRKSPDLQNPVARGPQSQHPKHAGKGKALSTEAGRKGSAQTHRDPEVTRFTYRVFWSADDECYVGTCAEFPSLSHLDDSMQGALNGISDLVADVVTDLRREKSPIPSPLASKRFSGAFKVRIPPMIHQRLALEAAEQGVSLNRLVSAKLSA